MQHSLAVSALGYGFEGPVFDLPLLFSIFLNHIPVSQPTTWYKKKDAKAKKNFSLGLESCEGSLKTS